MSALGKGRILGLPDDTDDYPNQMEPASTSSLQTHGSDGLAFGSLTGQIFDEQDQANVHARQMTSSTPC